MYGLTRATTTLLAAAVAGFLIWLASQFSNHHEGGYWAIMGVLAGAGLVMALSQLLGGWTKWGIPRLSASFFLFAFGTGLVFGFSFDTAGPVVRETTTRRRTAAPVPVEDRAVADEPTTAERAAARPADREYAGTRRGTPPPE